MALTPLEEVRNARLQKVAELREMGINPFPSRSSRSHYAQPLKDRFSELEGQTVTVAGRVMSWRKHGALRFGHVLDQTGTIQLYIRRDTLTETDVAAGTLGYGDLRLVDIGDLVESTGVLTRTERGEISVLAHSFRLLTKSLRPLPDKWSGLKDREAILRRRYLDTIMDGDSRLRFEQYGKMLFEIRRFLHDRGFIEIPTPVIQPQYGGGTAKPFTTHVNALDCRMFLAISHELYLKRLVAGGYDKVYTIGRYFRNEGIDRTHHPEFSMIETMTAYENYEYNMALIEDLFRHIALQVFGRTVFTVRGHSVDFGTPWTRLRMTDAVLAETGIDFDAAHDHAALSAVLAERALPGGPTIGDALVAVFEAVVAPKLIQPTLIYGHPVEISPLAKSMDSDPRYAERFEIFIGGMECGDNWSEQNDPVKLLERWRSQLPSETEKRRDLEYQPLDYDFIETLEYGIAPTTGIGPGIERMAMIFTEQENIDDVIFFPIMRPVISQANRAIYGIPGGPGEVGDTSGQE